MANTDLREINSFLSKYHLQQINPQTLLIYSTKTQFLVKNHHISSDENEEVLQILDKHLSLDPQYVCPLVHFQKEGQNIIRAVYQIDKYTLEESICTRRENNELFTQQEIWILLSSLVNSLIYLQQQDIVYGVLSPRKIFIEDKIRVMDPSAFNITPVNVSRISLHSPQIRQNNSDIDFYLSDVYLLGLCILSTATLKQIDNKVEKQEIDNLLKFIEKKYSSDLLHVLKYMLKDFAEQRPSFLNIREYIQTQIQIREARISNAELLATDDEDLAEENHFLQQIDLQYVDILEIDHIEQQTNAYEQARQKYLYNSCQKVCELTNCHSTINQSANIDSIEMIGQKQTLNLKSKNYYNIPEFKLGYHSSYPNNQTIIKNRKRAHQIKDRNSQVLKAIHSIVLPQNPTAHPFTSPQLMNMLKQQTERAYEYFTGNSRSTKLRN